MEEWKTVPGYETYRISNTGRVQRWKVVKKEWKEITPTCYQNNKYLMFTVSKNGNAVKLYLHRVLADLFVPNDNPKEFTDVCFKDGLCTNLSIENLYWSNQKERMGRRKAEGKYDGEVCGNAKLSKLDVVTIRWMKHHKAMSYKELAAYYNVHEWTIYACVKGLTWKHVQ
jgi:hypothetical protein